MIKNIITRHNESEEDNKKIKFFFTIFLVIFVLFSFSRVSFASTEVYFQKEIGEIIKGDTFSLNLKISSKDKKINVIDGTITYDKDKLEIKKVKIDNSLLSLWVKEPVFDNEIGELSFVGGVIDGFRGKDGQVLEITFFAQKGGSAIVGFKDVFSVFINDGVGTRINPWLKPMSLSIDKKSDILTEKVLDYLLPINMNYKYYLGVFVLILLSIIMKLSIRFIKKKNDK